MDELRKAEVENLHLLPLGQENIRGFDVAVNDALRMCGIETFGDLHRNFQCFLDR